MKRPVPDEVILGLLRSRPAHGYDLLDRFRSPNQLGRMWTLSTSQLYAVLKRLEEEGAIEGKQVFPSDAPAKMVYSVTDKGVSKLEKWIYDLKPSASIHCIRVLFLSRLYIADLLGISVTEIIENQKSVCEKQRIIFLNEKEKAGTSFEKLTLDFIIGQLEAAIKWLGRCENKLSANTKDHQLSVDNKKISQSEKENEKI